MATCLNCERKDVDDDEILTVRGGGNGCSSCAIECMVCNEIVYEQDVRYIDKYNDNVCVDCVKKKFSV